VTGLSRGGALIETALTVGIVMTVLLATMQLGILGFKQTAQDGAAFVAAHIYAQSPASGVTRATAAASGAFDAVPKSTIAVTTNGGTVTATVSSTVQTPSIPGSPPAVSLRSGATERLPAAPGTPGAFSAVGTLSNYHDATGAARATRALLVAQIGLPSTAATCLQSGGGDDGEGDDEGSDGYGGDGGSHGWFDEWSCRASVYSSLGFPSQRPKGCGGSNTEWDPSYSGSPLYVIYRWDNVSSGQRGDGYGGDDGSGCSHGY
jgi:hypothetical protein